MNNSRALFDDHARDYDLIFSESWLGRYYRQRTQAVFQKYWNKKTSILELNAGTGEDAIFLAELGHQILATDISLAMLQMIEHKITNKQLENQVSLKQLDIGKLDKILVPGFKGILSNFGGLNCINNWQEFAINANRILEDEGIVIVCIMGPKVPWEWLWFILKGNFNKAFRRFKGQSYWQGAEIYYPDFNQFESIMLSQSFNLIHREALGFLMPPSYASDHVEKWPKTYQFLAKIEEFFCRSKLACSLADHYLLAFKKK